jgi:dihydrofolate reductase
MIDKRKVISYIAMSLDGYIAKTDGDISFLSKVEKKGEDYGYSDFIKTIDTIIVGRKTYEKTLSLGFEYPGDKNIFVITRNVKPSHGRINYYSGSLSKLVSELRNKNGKNIFCDGGSEIINELLHDNLIDEFIISIIPLILGDGISLFKNGNPQLNLKLINCEKFDKDLVQLHYTRIENLIKPCH